MYQPINRVPVASQKITLLKFLWSVLEAYGSRYVFVTLEKHMKECGALDNHLVFLIKGIAEQYFKLG